MLKLLLKKKKIPFLTTIFLRLFSDSTMQMYDDDIAVKEEELSQSQFQIYNDEMETRKNFISHPSPL